MIAVRFDEIARLRLGDLEGSGEITGIKADSRQAGPGDLLVRRRSNAQVVAVVGSAGKTTTKDILGALCAPHASTIWAERSLNNEIGLPLTVCRLEPETEILITEMGMRGAGQISELCRIAHPSIVVIPGSYRDG